MNMPENTPFIPLGDRLKNLREAKNESIDDVSGAVEIEPAELAQIESGKNRPSEDILLLLCNHFDLEGNDMNDMWNLAGYERPRPINDNPFNSESPNQQTMMVMLDPRVMYSDSVEAIAGDRGVTLHFSQMHAGLDGKPLLISRIGMSRVQAEQLLGILHQVLHSENHDTPPEQTNNPN